MNTLKAQKLSKQGLKVTSGQIAKVLSFICDDKFGCFSFETHCLWYNVVFIDPMHHDMSNITYLLLGINFKRERHIKIIKSIGICIMYSYVVHILGELHAYSQFHKGSSSKFS